MKVTHCPTKQMVADFLMKPVQGALFQDFRRVLLGHEHMDSIKEDTTMNASKEHVGSCDGDKSGMQQDPITHMEKMAQLAPNDVTGKTASAVPASREGKRAVATATHSYAEAVGATHSKDIILE